jgi:hypothetical protein
MEGFPGGEGSIGINIPVFDAGNVAGYFSGRRWPICFVGARQIHGIVIFAAVSV